MYHWIRRFGVLFALVALCSLAATPAFAQQRRQATIYTFPAGETIFPEGVAYHAGNGDFFVGSTASGAVYRGNAWGRDRTLKPFLPGGADGRTTAIGMKVNPQGQLFIAGGATGNIWMYDAVTGRLLSQFNTGISPTFINDVTVTPDGSAYFTDSVQPFIYRIKADAQGVFQYEIWRDLRGSAIQYGQGFNLNGIAHSPDGKYLVVVQSSNGKLFRISTETKDVSEIAIAGGDTFTAGDGILIDGQTLHIARNNLNLLVQVRMNEDFSRGQQVGSFTDASFRYTTTFAKVGGDLLVVNSQFDKRGGGATPELPFTISRVSLP